MKYDYHRAVKAALHGPEVKKLKLAGDHEFNIKPFHSREDGASTVTVGGQISHCRSPWADEQIQYAIQAAKGQVVSVEWQFSESTLAPLFRLTHVGGSIAVSVFVPPLGAALLQATDRVTELAVQFEELATGKWEDSCKHLIALIAAALASELERADEWARASSPPSNAVLGGRVSDSKEPMYVGRFLVGEDMHLGKVAFYDGKWRCYIGNGGQEMAADQYEILVGDPSKFVWVPTTNALPERAVVGGYAIDSPYMMFVGRASHNGNIHPGKVAFYAKGWRCYIGNGGEEQRYDSYEVLVRK